MNSRSFFTRLCHSLTPRCAAILLVTMVWSSLAFCGEIHDAVKAGDLEKVKALLKAHPDLISSKDIGGRTPLRLAVWIGRKDMAALLLANKAEVNAKDNNGWTELHWAAVSGHKDMVELLIAHGAEVNVHDAAAGGDLEKVKTLLKDNPDLVFSRDNVGQTPLHWAAYAGREAVAELLLSNKAEVNAKDNKGETPLYLAVTDRPTLHRDRDRERLAGVVRVLRQHGGHE